MTVQFAQHDWAVLAELKVDGKAISNLWIVPFTLRIGKASVRMDGIAGVGTDVEHRNKGYSRKVMEATIEHMREGDAALAMLYGIRDFYPKFGFATAGPDQFISLKPADAPLPEGWGARDLSANDLSALKELYEENTRQNVGCAIHPEGSGRWRRMLESVGGENGDGCRVILDPGGRVQAYVWRGADHWYSGQIERYEKAVLSIAEVMAESPTAASAALALCRQWGVEEGRRRDRAVEQVLISQPPEGRVAAAAMRQDAELIARYDECGSSMVRTIDAGRLLHSLLPELQERLADHRSNYTGRLLLETETATVSLEIEDGRLLQIQCPAGASVPGHTARLRVPQYELARLALGVFPPESVLERIEPRPDERTWKLVEAIFPHCHPHMYLADRF